MDARNMTDHSELNTNSPKGFLAHWRDSMQRLTAPDVIGKRVQQIILFTILAATLVIRLLTLHAPALDRTMWKEIDYITISQNYTENGFAFFRPEIEWPAEEPRVTAMELPIVPYAAALLYSVFGFNVYTVRILTVLGFLLASFFVYKLATREMGPVIGLGAAALSAVMPLWHPFGHILFSEPWVIAFSVGCLYHFAEWVDSRRTVNAVAAGVFFSLAVALKLTPLYMLLPLGWVAFRSYRFDVKAYVKPLAILAAAMVVPIAWYSYAYWLTQNSIDVFGIFGGHDKMQTVAMLSKPEWWSTIFRRMRSQIFGGNLLAIVATVGALSGLSFFKRTNTYVAYGVAVAAFFFIVAEGQIDAPYRQLVFVPVAAALVAFGVTFLGATLYALFRTLANRGAATPIAATVVLASLMLLPIISLRANADDVFRESPRDVSHPSEWELARAVRRYADDDGKIVTAGAYTIHKGGNDLSPVLYYYAGVRGWSLQANDWDLSTVDELASAGATLFAAQSMDREPESVCFVHCMKRTYPVLYENTEQDLLLLDLTTRANHEPTRHCFC